MELSDVISPDDMAKLSGESNPEDALRVVVATMKEFGLDAKQAKTLGYMIAAIQSYCYVQGFRDGMNKTAEMLQAKMKGD